MYTVPRLLKQAKRCCNSNGCFDGDIAGCYFCHSLPWLGNKLIHGMYSKTLIACSPHIWFGINFSCKENDYKKHLHHAVMFPPLCYSCYFMIFAKLVSAK